jgi:arsenite methyltransferase
LPDPYANIREVPVEMQRRLANALDTRAADPSQVEIRRRYFANLHLPPGAKAVEFGSGTGHVTRDLIEVVGAAEAIGIEPSAVLIARAREQHSDVPGLKFQEGDAATTGMAAGSIDLVVMHTLVCHAPAVEALLSEAARIIKPGGLVAVFDGDYELTSVALSGSDPLQAVVNRWIDLVHDRWVPRRLGKLLAAAGFKIRRTDIFGYTATDPAYFMTVIERGADLLVADGVLGQPAAEAMKAEGRRRLDEGTFFGSIPYVCVIAVKQ